VTTAAARLAARVRARRAGLVAGVERVSLRGRLVTVITVLVAAGLVLAGLTSTALLQRSLVAQIDDKLKTEGLVLANRQINSLIEGLGSTSAPSDYYLRLEALGVEVPWASPSVLDAHGTPQIPNLDAAGATALAGQAFTVSSDHAGSRWRVVAYAVGTDGSVVVALPLAEANKLTSTMAAVLLLSGVGIVLLGGLAAGWAVRRSLAPLGAIEDTAAAIAAGDLTRRVPTAPATTEVGRLGVAINGMLVQIERAFAQRSASEARMRRFVADASHELRTPLAAVRGYAELYRQGAVTTRQDIGSTMRRIEDESIRMGGLVNDLLLLTRLDGHRPVERGPVDLTVVAADAVQDARALDPARQVRLLGLSGDLEPTTIEGDEAKLRQVVTNLMGNAVNHTAPGTSIEIAVGRDSSGRARLEVRDHGNGVDPVKARKVFERFYREDPSRGRGNGGGNGLGLAIVRELLRRCDGSISLQDNPSGPGLAAVVHLPARSFSSAVS